MLLVLQMEVVGETGRFWEAVVEGLRSWAGSGLCLMEADWIAEAMSTAGLDMLTGRPRTYSKSQMVADACTFDT